MLEINCCFCLYASLFAITNYFLYKFFQMQVPPGIRNGIVFRCVNLVLHGLRITSHTCEALGMANRANFVKKFVSTVETLNSNSTINENDTITVTETKIEDVVVRIYKPKSVKGKTPLMIFYHGGGYVLQSARTYDYLTYVISKKLNITVISVDYKLAPEHKYPAPVEDCWTVTNYVLNNPNEFNIDIDRVVIAGDSAGGNATAVITQRLSNAGHQVPKLQILIYPWLQQVNFALPSYEYYRKRSIFAVMGVSILDLAIWYMGYSKKDSRFRKELTKGTHLLLVKDKDLRKKYVSYLDPAIIPTEYKSGRSYYNDYPKLDTLVDADLDEANMLKTDPNLAQIAKNMLNFDVSPILADDDTLKRLPQTYMIVCESDELKDEGLIYAERLKQNNVKIKIAFYKDAYHGIISAIKAPMINTIGVKIVNDMIDYINENI